MSTSDEAPLSPPPPPPPPHKYASILATRRALSFGLANDTLVSQQFCFEMSLPVPLFTPCDCEAIDFRSDEQRARWHEACAQRTLLVRRLASGRVDEMSLESTEAAIDTYARTMSLLVTTAHSDASLRPGVWRGDATSLLHAPFYAWRSALNQCEYASTFLSFDCYMAQILAFSFLVSRALALRLDAVEAWQRVASTCTRASDAPDAIAAWARDDAPRRGRVVEYFRRAREAAARARTALAEWGFDLRNYTAMRYPPEVSREFSFVLDEIALFWTQHMFVETHSAGLVFVDEAPATTHRWYPVVLETAAAAAPPLSAERLAALNQWLVVHGLALARYFARFTVTSRLVAPTFSAIGDVAARAALYQHVYVLVERERIDAAYAACLALRRLEWSAVRHDVFALTTLSELFCLVRPHASVEMPLPTSRDAANIVIAKAKLEMLCSVTPRYYSDA